MTTTKLHEQAEAHDAELKRLQARRDELTGQLDEASNDLKKARRQMIAGKTDDVTTQQARVTGLEGALSDLSGMIDMQSEKLESARQEAREASLSDQLAKQKAAAATAQQAFDTAHRQLEDELVTRFDSIVEAEEKKHTADNEIRSLKKQLGQSVPAVYGARITDEPSLGDYGQAVFEAVERSRGIRERLERKQAARNREAA